MADILIVGAGPVGLTMAAELARHGTRCRIIDRLMAPSPYCRAIGITPRTLEVWDDMGIAREMIDAGLWLDGLRSIVHGRPPSDTLIDLSDLPYAHLGIPQYETERILARHLGRFGIEIEREVTLTGLTQDADSVAVSLDRAGGRTETATFRYVIGCDGAHSAVRHHAGIAFKGDAFPMMFMLGDVHIAWDLPRGRSLRALRLVEDGPPDLFVAIPLPETGRYRVSMIAPAEFSAPHGTDHGIQSERPGPSLRHLQAVADDLLPDKPTLSDLRWSSLFRISMRLAENYRRDRVFLAGDAAHIHPPTGGQGMNTGIQDAYNLAWKLALVLKGAAPAALLDSYEAERRPVGADVVARTRRASETYGREGGAPPDRLADTQIRISYRGTPWVRDRAGSTGDGLPSAGDRAPDAVGLRRPGVGFPLRLHDCLRGTEHVLIARPAGADGSRELDDLATFAAEISPRCGSYLRVIAIVAEADLTDRPHVAVYRDAEGQFSQGYGAVATTLLVRPDGHIGWRGTSWCDADLTSYLAQIIQGGAFRS
ncbi:FAD-dependent monooxygenase [Inquilinus limosus]|uniref:FAD-dependent monooxygenase n=1 Tax=Inquilinus limosus TaxID=171674 RepID=UPI003F171700